MQFIELRQVEAKFCCYGRLQLERLVLLPGDGLYAEMFQIVDLQTVESFYE